MKITVFSHFSECPPETAVSENRMKSLVKHKLLLYDLTYAVRHTEELEQLEKYLEKISVIFNICNLPFTEKKRSLQITLLHLELLSLNTRVV